MCIIRAENFVKPRRAALVAPQQCVKRGLRRNKGRISMQDNVERELNLFIERAEDLEKSSFLLAGPKLPPFYRPLQAALRFAS